MLRQCGTALRCYLVAYSVDVHVLETKEETKEAKLFLGRLQSSKKMMTGPKDGMDIITPDENDLGTSIYLATTSSSSSQQLLQ